MTAFHRTKEWAALSRRMRPVFQAHVDEGSAVCVDCGRAIWHGQTWQVGHRLSAALYPEYALEDWNLGPSHRRCNQSAGGKDGAAKTNRMKKRKQEGEFPKW